MNRFDLGATFWAAVFIAATALGGTTQRPEDGAAKGELTLAGLRPGRDKLARAIKLYGKRYTQTYQDAPDQLLWADARRKLFLRLELANDQTITSVIASSFGPERAPFASLPPAAQASGRGLRLGERLEKALRIYGQPYFRGPSTEGGRDLILVVYKFSAEEDQPQVLELSFDPKTERLVKMALSFPYY